MSAPITAKAPSPAESTLTRWLEQLPGQRDPEEKAYLRGVGHYVADKLDREALTDPQRGLEHGLAVASILAELDLDRDTLAAALLEEAVTLSAVSQAEVTETFGQEIGALVGGVLRMDAIREHQQASGADSAAQGQAESLRRMLLAMVADVRVVLIKLAVRLHNLRLARDLSEQERRYIAQETMDIFAPLANRLGIWQVKWELEDLSFRFLEPATYKRLARSLAERRVDRDRYLARVVRTLREKLGEQNIDTQVSSRSKHIYSIWKKMQRKEVEFDQIFDVRAIRILVPEVRDCYAALGVVHGLWQHIPKEFDDYIASPKNNLYRSLHTAVVGPEGRTLEVQVRTQDMHDHAELGVAAHWRYKEGVSSDPGFERKLNWMRQLLEWKDEMADNAEFLDHFRAESDEARIYVFTPQGKIVDLQPGATPLDFAYRIHSDVGHRCRGAKVDGHIVSLTHVLNSGEQVEILTTKRGQPSRDWLNPHLGYIATSRARSKVRHWFAEQDYEKNLSAGRGVLDRALHQLGIETPNYEQLMARFHRNKLDDLLVSIGRGDISQEQIDNALAKLYPPPVLEQPPLTKRRQAKRKKSRSDDIEIDGVGDLLTQKAKCCKPLPSDPIVGFITRGRGVTIHRKTCPNILRMSGESRDRLIEVKWSNTGTETAANYPVDVQVEAYDRPGLLRDVTQLLATEHINVLAINTSTDRHHHMAYMTLRVEITGLDQLGRVLTRIKDLSNVLVARRQA